MKQHLVRMLAAVGAVALLATSCGGSDEASRRTRNSVACFDTQEDKDAAIAVAQEQFNLSMEGTETPPPSGDESNSSTSSSIEGEESDSSTSSSIEREQSDSSSSTLTSVSPSTSSTSSSVAPSTTLRPTTTSIPLLLVPPSPPLEEASGSGGYVRPALLVRNGDDTSSSVEESTTPPLTDEQVMALNLLETTRATPLCSEIEELSSQEEDFPESSVTCTAVLTSEIIPSIVGAECNGPLPYGIAVHTFEQTEEGGLASYQWYYNGSPIYDSASWDVENFPSIAPEVTLSGDLLEGSEEQSYDGPSVMCSLTMTTTNVSSTCEVRVVLFAQVFFVNAPAEVVPSQRVSHDTVVIDFGDDAETMAAYDVVVCIENSSEECVFEDGLGEVRYSTGESRTEYFEVPCPECSDTRWTQGSAPSGVGFVLYPNRYSTSTLEFAAPGTCAENDLQLRLWDIYPHGAEANDVIRGFAYEWNLTLEIPDVEEADESSTSSSSGVVESTTSSVEVSQRPDYCAVAYYPSGDDPVAVVILSETPAVFYSTNIQYFDNLNPDAFFNPPTFDAPAVYEVSSAADYFTFEVEEATDFGMTATSGQECPDADPDTKGDGFVDVEIEIYQIGETFQLSPFSPTSLPEDELYWADNNFHGLGEVCSGAYLNVELKPGRYVVRVGNSDYSSVSDRGTITVESSLELATVNLISLQDFDMRSITGVVAPTTLLLDVPSGGGFVAITVEPATDECIDSDDPIVEVWRTSSDSENPDPEYVMYNDDEGEEYGLKCNSSAIITDLDEGSYELRVYQYYEEEGPQAEGFTVSVGFYSKRPDAVEVVQVSAAQDPPPPSVATVQADKFPTEAVISGAQAAVIIDEGVETMVCKSACIDTLFALEGVVGDTLVIDAGGEPVTISRSDRKVIIPVRKGGGTLAVLQKESSVATREVWSAEVVSVAAGFDPATAAITSYSRGGGRELLIILSVMLALAALGGVLARRRARRLT